MSRLADLMGWGKPKEKPLVVTFDLTETGSYSCDHSYTEVEKAYAEGKAVQCRMKFGGSITELKLMNSYLMTFLAVTDIGIDGGIPFMDLMEIYFYQDSSVRMQNMRIKSYFPPPVK